MDNNDIKQPTSTRQARTLQIDNTKWFWVHHFTSPEVVTPYKCYSVLICHNMRVRV